MISRLEIKEILSSYEGTDLKTLPPMDRKLIEVAKYARSMEKAVDRLSGQSIPYADSRYNLIMKNIRELDKENRRMKKIIDEMPQKIRAGMTSRKGEAMRVAYMVTRES